MTPVPPGYDYAGRTAVVTGGSGVLCGAICRALAGCGARVVVVACQNSAKAEALVREITEAGGTALAACADVTSRDAVCELAAMVQRHFGAIDILVNGAGGAKKGATTSAELSFFDLPPEAVKDVMELNFLGTFLPCQVFSQTMQRDGGGVILNISSMGAVRPLTRSVAYSAAKAAVSNFTQWLAVHLAQEYDSTIRVNALVPGFFLTEQNRFLLTDERTGELTERGQRIIAQTPMARFGTPEDLVGPALWLLSDQARFVHGTTLVVDGGLDAYGGV